MIVSGCQLSMIEMQESRRPVILENDVSVEIVLQLAVRMNIESIITHYEWRIHTIIHVLYLCMLCFQLCKPDRKRRFHIGVPSLANALDLLHKKEAPCQSNGNTLGRSYRNLEHVSIQRPFTSFCYLLNEWL